jgi:signal transduction histidine kinase
MARSTEVEASNAKASIPEEQIEELLTVIRTNISKVHHELNNPLSIICGNAELLITLAQLMDLGDDIVGPLKDIEVAGQQMADSMHKLIVLREMISRRQKGENSQEGA